MNDDDALNDLKLHWSSAYMIFHPAPDRWQAQRRDNDEMLTASTPDVLLGMIRSDYLECPVSRGITRRGGGGAGTYNAVTRIRPGKV